MSPHEPRFTVGNPVCEKAALAAAIRERGIVIKGYEFDGEYCYVVKFESGREADSLKQN